MPSNRRRRLGPLAAAMLGALAIAGCAATPATPAPASTISTELSTVATTPPPAATTPPTATTSQAAAQQAAPDTPAPQAAATTKRTTSQQSASSTCSSSSYVNVDGRCVPRPTHADSPPAGATARCNDGTYSFSQHRQGTCSGHGGVAAWL
ncbi:MAG TPA: DUF3761 domain-containing protein [Amycolatopsis sp.]|nr:DUF3761 domain-containing protein [Amycolatopsis sp.]